MARLKVFQAHMGFFDSIVAAPSQKAALEAWGTRQDLFGEGLASQTTEAAAVKAALATPGSVLKRAANSQGPFEPDPSAPAAPAGPPTSKAIRGASPKPRPDRSALDAAERALEAARTEGEQELTAIADQRGALEQREREARARYDRRTKDLRKAVDKARRAFERAGR